MLRRVARVLRAGLLVLGIAVLAWLPVSFFLLAGASWQGPKVGSWMYVVDGHAAVNRLEEDFIIHNAHRGVSFTRRNALDPVRLRLALATSYETYWQNNEHISYSQTVVTVPLWLLSTICLVWPVTSFIVARRKHKRGFPVVQTEVGAPSESTEGALK